jgi:hypothetical protein
MLVRAANTACTGGSHARCRAFQKSENQPYQAQALCLHTIHIFLNTFSAIKPQSTAIFEENYAKSKIRFRSLKESNYWSVKPLDLNQHLLYRNLRNIMFAQEFASM